MAQQSSNLFWQLDKLIETMSARVRTNSVITVVALATGTTAYIGGLMAAWFALVERSDAIVASVVLAAASALITLALVAYRAYRDRQRHKQQAVLQSQLVSSLLSVALAKTSQSNAVVAPVAALIGWAMAKQNQPQQNVRRLS
jgi:uncharacterized membrane protein YiaA